MAKTWRATFKEDLETVAVSSREAKRVDRKLAAKKTKIYDKDFSIAWL